MDYSIMERKIYLFKAASDEEAKDILAVNRSSSSNATNIIPTGNNDRFVTFLDRMEIKNELVPVLSFEYSNLDNLWLYLKDPAQHSGIIFTSPRCVQSVTEAIKENVEEPRALEWTNKLRSEWESKYIFCVGPSTVVAAKQLFSSARSELIITGVESHAESLGNKIVEVHSRESISLPLLYPCGVQRRDVLATKLGYESIPFSECTVYQSVKNPKLKDIMESVKEELELSCEHREMVLCFFSPSGIQHVFQYLQHSLISHNHIVAIGPTTKAALQENLKSRSINKFVHECKQPTPEALLDVVKNIHIPSETTG